MKHAAVPASMLLALLIGLFLFGCATVARPGSGLNGTGVNDTNKTIVVSGEKKIEFSVPEIIEIEVGKKQCYSFCGPSLDLPSDICGAPYNSSVKGGNPPYHFQLGTSAGIPLAARPGIPLGMTLSPNGMLCGTPQIGEDDNEELRAFEVCVVDESATMNCRPAKMKVVRKVGLQASTGGAGSGGISVGGKACGKECSERVQKGAKVRVTAAPDADSEFEGWEGACTGTGACEIDMDSDKAVKARFRLKASAPLVTTAPDGKCTSRYDGVWRGTMHGTLMDEADQKTYEIQFNVMIKLACSKEIPAGDPDFPEGGVELEVQEAYSSHAPHGCSQVCKIPSGFFYIYLGKPGSVTGPLALTFMNGANMYFTSAQISADGSQITSIPGRELGWNYGPPGYCHDLPNTYMCTFKRGSFSISKE